MIISAEEAKRSGPFLWWVLSHLYAFPLIALLTQALARVRQDSATSADSSTRLSSLNLVLGDNISAGQHSLRGSHSQESIDYGTKSGP